MIDHGEHPSGPVRRRVAFFLAVLLIAAAAFAGYQRLYSSFAPYDDEGYVMLSLVSFLDGKPLYDETYSQYGPAYYFTHSFVHEITQLPVSHDVTRLKTLCFWLTVAGLMSAIAWRVTGRVEITAAAGLISFFHLERLAMEPGHPQELCVVLMSAALLGTTLIARRDSSNWTALAIGLLAGTVGMTKPNIGFFLALGLLLAFALSLAQSRRGLWFAILVSVTALAVPWVLMREVLFSAGGVVLAAVVTSSTAGTICVARRLRGEFTISLPTVGWFVFGCAAAGAGWLLAANMHGTSVGGLFEGLVTQHGRFGPVFFAASPIHWAAIPWSAICLWMAIAAANRNVTIVKVARALLGGAAVLVAICHFAETFQPLDHGLRDRGLALFLIAFVTPLVWAVLVQVSDPDKERRKCHSASFARLALCSVAALQVLGIFPTPGTQTAIASLLVLIVGLVAVADLSQLSFSIRSQPASKMRGFLATSLLVLAVATVACRDVWLWNCRTHLEPLNLPGAERLRLPREDVARHRWLTDALCKNADTFVFRYNAMNSYYFWTQLPPPTSLNATCWPVLFDAACQNRVLSSIHNHERVVVVWQPHDWPDLTGHAPLVQYLDEHFDSGLQRGTLEVRFPRRPPSM